MSWRNARRDTWRGRPWLFYEVRAEITIDRPVSDVYSFIADHENDPQWCRLVPETTRLGDEAGPGAHYRFVQNFGPTRHAGTIEVLEARPPSWIHLQSAVMGARFDTEYRLEPGDGTTRLIHVNRPRRTGLMRLLHPIQRKVTERIMNGQLRALKRILESSKIG